MGGVTNQLIEAANQSKAGNETAVGAVFARLKQRHNEVVTVLISSGEERRRLQEKLDELFVEGERLCRGTLLLRELTPRTLDAISGLGERLCAPMVAAALSEIGVAAEAIDATELVVTKRAPLPRWRRCSNNRRVASKLTRMPRSKSASACPETTAAK